MFGLSLPTYYTTSQFRRTDMKEGKRKTVKPKRKKKRNGKKERWLGWAGVHESI